MNGWLNIYKPKNYNSAKIVAIVKAILGGVKTGHAGTLDPLAEGVLPIAIGEATKLTEMLIEARKKYEFIVQFGARTTSGDLAGEEIAQCESNVVRSDIENILPKFIGEIIQIPSSFSAIKINGVRAYKYAHKNIEVKMPERRVTIYSLELLEFDAGQQCAKFVAECSKGTYIRSLAEDIAFSLQNLGHVIELRRLSVGKFDYRNAIYLPEEGAQNNLQQIYDQILPADFVLDDILVINVEDDIAFRIRNGQKVYFEGYADNIYAIYQGLTLLAIGKIENRFFKVKRVFNL